MIIVFGAIFLFALGGGFLAQKRGGQWADIVHYGAVFGLIGFVLGVLIVVIIARYYV